MSNAAAGSIIGKQGANITELQNKSAARLQLSRSSEFFPGTRDRVLICSGSVDQVVAALKLVITAVDTELVRLLGDFWADEKATMLMIRKRQQGFKQRELEKYEK